MTKKSLPMFGHDRTCAENRRFQKCRRVDFFTAALEIIIPNLFFPVVLGEVLTKNAGVEMISLKCAFGVIGSLLVLGNIKQERVKENAWRP